MEILNKISRVLNEKVHEIEAYQVRINEVKDKMENNQNVLEEKEQIIQNYLLQLNNIKEKSYRIQDIFNSLERKNAKFDEKCKENEAQLSEIFEEHKSLNAVATSMKNEYESTKQERELFLRNNTQNIQKILQKNKDDKIFLRNILQDTNKKNQQLENIISEMKERARRELSTMEIKQKSQRNLFNDKFNEVKSNNEKLQQIINEKQKERKKEIEEKRDEYKKLDNERKNESNSIKEEYKYKIKMLESKVEEKQEIYRKTALKMAKIMPQNENIIKEGQKLEDPQVNKASKIQKMHETLTQGNEKINKMRKISSFLKKEEQQLNSKINSLLLLNKQNAQKYSELSQVINNFEYERNKKVQNQAERTCNLRNKLREAKQILNNLDLQIITLQNRSPHVVMDLKAAFSNQKKYKTKMNSIKENISSIEQKIKELRIEKRNLNLNARLSPSKQQEEKEQQINYHESESTDVKSDLDMDLANQSTMNTSLSDFDSFNMSLHAPIIEDLTPLDSPVSYLGVRSDIQEVKSTLQMMLKQVEEKKKEIENMKSEDSELNRLRELNKELKFKVEHLDQMNKEIADIRSNKFVL